MVDKVNIYSDVVSFVRLLLNQSVKTGRDMRCILRNRANIFLNISEDQLLSLWNDVEGPFRKSCDALDLRCPTAMPELERLSEDPGLTYKLDPFGLWFLNTSNENIQRFKDYFGVRIFDAETISDDSLYLHHHREFDKDDVISGNTRNGWKNYFNQLPIDKPLPPLNAIVINDRYLINCTNEKTAAKEGFYGLNNMLKLLDAVLPEKLGIPFYLLIFCQHPNLPIEETDEIVQRFVNSVKKLRDSSYSIEVEIIYGVSRHKRTFHTNYFSFDIDRGYNAFYKHDMTRLCGENDFSLDSLMNDPNCSGETNYEIARRKLKKISAQCYEAITNPQMTPPVNKQTGRQEFSLIRRTYPLEIDQLKNRLFS